MLSVQARFPANQQAETIKNPGPLAERPDRLPIPYAFSDPRMECSTLLCRRVAAFTSVPTHLWPCSKTLHRVLHGCASEGYEWSLQLSALSSYTLIKVWKIDPLAYCPLGNNSRTD